MEVKLGNHDRLVVPDDVVHNIRQAHGDDVDSWLSTLGPTLAALLESLDARIIPGDPPLSWHLVFYAETSDGTELAIKCTVPNREQRSEVAGVQALSTAGIGPRLLRECLGLGVIVMERVRPGTILPARMPTLSEDAKVTHIIATLAATMARSVNATPFIGKLLDVREYSQALDMTDSSSLLWPDHRQLVDRALELRDKLLDDPNRRDVFLHGDLHHYNILCDGSLGWSVIDPKGLIGPAGYEFGAFAYNPMGIHEHPLLAELMRQRITIWAELTGLSPATIRSWGFVAAMLSACWSAEAGADGWQGAIKIASTLRDLASQAETLPSA